MRKMQSMTGTGDEQAGQIMTEKNLKEKQG